MSRQYGCRMNQLAATRLSAFQAPQFSDAECPPAESLTLMTASRRLAFLPSTTVQMASLLVRLVRRKKLPQ